jgi:N-methylhydantoinase A
LPVPANPAEVNSIFDYLEKQAVDGLKAEGFTQDNIRIQRAVDMLYGRQVHVVTAPIEKQGELGVKDLEAVCDRFEELYEGKYGQGSAYREAGMIIVCLRLRATGLLKKPVPYRYDLSGENPEKAYLGIKEVYFEKSNGTLETRIFDFLKLVPGNLIEGPAIILTPITTVVVFPGHKAYCDEFKNIILSYK